MTDINSELQRLKAADPLAREEIFQSICASFTPNALAAAIAAIVPSADPPRAGKAERGARPSSEK